MNRNKAIVPLHHRKEGWPSDSKKSEASTDREAGVVFRMKTKRKTTPAASALVASRNVLMTQPPLLVVMQGVDYLLHSNLFTASMTAGDLEIEIVGGYRPPLQWYTHYESANSASVCVLRAAHGGNGPRVR